MSVKVTQQRSDDDRVRAFRRHRQAQPALQLSVFQAQQILQTKNYYASLSPRQTFVDGKGYLNFIFRGSPERAEVSGQNGTAHFPNSDQVMEIGLRSNVPSKNYLLDCTVKGPGPCYECFFEIDGPDGQTEQWDMTNSEWRHLLFTVSPGDREWYVLKLWARISMTFQSCDVMQLP